MAQNCGNRRLTPGTEERPNIQVIIAHIHSAWNYQKRFTVSGSRSGFSTDQWLCCSRLGANVQVSGQNPFTFRVIYHQALLLVSPQHLPYVNAERKFHDSSINVRRQHIIRVIFRTVIHQARDDYSPAPPAHLRSNVPQKRCKIRKAALVFRNDISQCIPGHLTRSDLFVHEMKFQ